MEKNQILDRFSVESKFNFAKDSQPRAVKLETVTVEIHPSDILGDYAKYFCTTAEIKSQVAWQQADLTIDEFENYCKFMLYQRIAFVHGECKVFSQMTHLWIPVYIQLMMETIGIVTLKTQGLMIDPVAGYECPLTIEEAKAISNKLYYLQDVLTMVTGGFPNHVEGDAGTMSTALISGYVRGLSIDQVHPSFTYVTAFLGFKLREEASFQVLYRTQYDDLSIIRDAVSLHREAFLR